MTRINILPPLLANQIAAGEVIERPASVVKELLENAIDAGAKRIKIDIQNAGSQLIRIQDDGMGIHKDDLSKAIARHGTSKISDLIDLQNIYSLGFRGEALASIAAIAEMTLESCHHEADAAWQIKVKGVNSQIAPKPTAHPQGTTVTVYDLFAATPARKKFLKTLKTEFFHIEETIKRLALANFNVRFEFNHNQKSVFLLAAASDELTKEKRLASLLNKNFIQHAVKLDAQTQDLHISGWVADANFTRPSSDMQYIFINGRYVKDKVMQHAIKQAFQPFALVNRYPALVLYLKLNAELFDVNVHPTKHEVRFYESRLIHDFVYQALKQALQVDNADALNQKSQQLNENIASEQIHQHQPTENAVAEQIHPHQPTQPYVTQNYVTSAAKPISEQALAQTQAFYQSAPAMELPTMPAAATVQLSKKPALRYIGQIAKRYLIYDNLGLQIIDAKTVMAAIAAERYSHELYSHAVKQANLLIPTRLQLTATQTKQVKDITLLKAFGLQIDYISETTLVLRKVPKVFMQVDWVKFIQDLINYWLKFMSLSTKGQQDYIIQLMQQHLQLATIDANEITQLIMQYEALFKSKKITYMQEWTLQTLAKQFHQD
ncbi:MAG: DNA mismatch repair endonuclease MutL [Pseudomonadota bacterium]